MVYNLGMLIRKFKYPLRKIYSKENLKKYNNKFLKGGKYIMEDKTIVCKDCNNEFVFTAGEQEFYAEKGFSDPVRCKACRDARKARNNEKNNQ